MANIAVVVLDTLRKDAFDRHFDWLPGKRFENAWSTSHWTVPVHGSLFTGRYPSELGVHAKSIPLDVEEPVLAESLRQMGYTTRAFSANPYVSPVFDFDRGFDDFTGNWRLRQLDPALFDWNRFVANAGGKGRLRYLRAVKRCVQDDCKTLPSLVHGLKLKLRDWDILGYVDDDGASEALSYVRGTDFESAEFLYVNLMEAHTPYDPPAAYRTVDVTHGPGLRETIAGDGDEVADAAAVAQAYDDCVRYLSDVYREIFSELVADFDYVVTLSDHGELLGEHGGWAHGYGLYTELTKVPLSIYGEGVTDDDCDELVSLTDTYRTVLDLASAETESPEDSLLQGGRDDSILTEYHGLTSLRASKLRDAGVDEQLLRRYDQPLRGIVQPDCYGFETPDGFVLSGECSADEARARLDDLVAGLDVRPVDVDDRRVSDDVRSQLEDLGYA